MGKETASSTQVQEAEKTDNLWNSILAEASRSVSDRLESRTLVLLGTRTTFYIIKVLYFYIAQ
jgi:hypothetical protein